MENGSKHPLNVEGKFFVDFDVCLDHECCVEIAPNNFKMDEKNWTAFIFKQPSKEEENLSCIEAMNTCPVEAIRDDG